MVRDSFDPLNVPLRYVAKGKKRENLLYQWIQNVQFLLLSTYSNLSQFQIEATLTTASDV